MSMFSGCSSNQNSASSDPYLWLEEIEGKKALQWVDAQNAVSKKIIEGDPDYNKYLKTAQELIMDKDRIPLGAIRGSDYYNFWQDEKHVKGIWRRTPLSQFKLKNLKWETLLDVDALAKSENENWVFKGSECSPFDPNSCLLRLSRGGKDAVVIREFDLKTKTFKQNGFYIKEAKSDFSWWDTDHILVATDFGKGTLTTSGYPRTVRLWKRGQDINSAILLFEGKDTDVYISGYKEYGSGGNWGLINREITFYEAENFLIKTTNNQSFELIKIPVPNDANFRGLFREKALYLLNSDWTVGEKKYSSGTLVSVNVEEILSEKKISKLEEIFIPTKSRSLDRLTISGDSIVFTVLNDVKSELFITKRLQTSWQIQKMPEMGIGSIQIMDSRKDQEWVQFQFQNFLRPTELHFLNTKSNQTQLAKKLSSKFDNQKFKIEQHFATSLDGTKIPYFLVANKKIKKDGKNKTLLYGYGGFQISVLPSYSSTSGKLWLEQGGVHVYANIRGGGEYGPQWHQAAQKEKRHKAFEDFIAIAEDLIAQKITSPQHLGIMGGSNGGLLVSSVMLKRPDLFNAVICSVPLTDMLRYHKLLAGASWMAEYGNPDDAKMRVELLKYSPYQKLQPNQKLPHVFFVTSTKDDRVHPGHARKLAAKMKDMGYDFYYFENRDGGHGVSANLNELAKRTALQYIYLKQKLL